MKSTFYQQEREILSNDDAKVNEQDKRVNQDFMTFSTDLYKNFNCTLDFTEPKSLYAPYDLAMMVKKNDEPLDGKYGYIIEIKERYSHYDSSYMIDVPKIEKIRGIINKQPINARLVIQEPKQDKIYVFNINRIDWDNVTKEWKNVRATTTRSYTDVRVDKEFYLLDWGLAKVFDFKGWSQATKEKFAAQK